MSRATIRPLLVGAAALSVSSLPAVAQVRPDTQKIRRELRIMEALLDQTVEQVSQANAGFVLAGAPVSRGYLIRGDGVVFVLPPRRLPAPTAMVRRTSRGIVMIQGGPPSDLRRVEAQVAEFQRQAQQEWDLLERSFFEVQARLLRAAAEQEGSPWGPPVSLLPPPKAAGPGDAGTSPESSPAVGPSPVRGSAPVAGQPAALPVESQAVPALPDSPGLPPEALSPVLAPAPPWSLWSQDAVEEPEPRSPDRLVEDTRNALVQVLEAHGHILTSVPPEETISVVVDFVAGAPFLDESTRPARSLSLRVRKRDLDERRAGRLPAEELRRRVESVEY